MFDFLLFGRFVLVDFGLARGVRVSWLANAGGAVHLLLEAGVAHSCRMTVGDFLLEDRIVGDFVPVNLFFELLEWLVWRGAGYLCTYVFQTFLTEDGV